MLRFEEEILEATSSSFFDKSMRRRSFRNLCPTFDLNFWVKTCVFIDFLGVAFVVPLLSSYLRDAGVDSEIYGLMSSSFYFSQIIGSLTIGVLLDSLSRRNLLILSFLGSAISYAIVGLSKELWLLFASRVIVGLVKQTYTISTSILASTCSDHSRRAELMGHLSAATTLAFIIGPTMGSMLYTIDARLPAMVSSCLFVLNIVICFVTIPDVIPSHVPHSPNANPANHSRTNTLAHVEGALSPIVALVVIAFVERSMTNTNIMSYFELRYDLSTASLGYVSSISSLVAFVAQLFFIKPMLALCGGNELAALYCALVVCAFANFIEGNCVTIYHYLMFFIPFSVTGASILLTLSRSVLSCVVPPEHIGKALGTLGLLESGVGVLAPIYSARVFAWSGHSGRGAVAAVHYMIAAVIVWGLLRGAHMHEHKGTVLKGDEHINLAIPVGDDAGSIATTTTPTVDVSSTDDSHNTTYPSDNAMASNACKDKRCRDDHQLRNRRPKKQK